MSCFTLNMNKISDDTFKRFDLKSAVKVILCLILYAIFECVICDENEFHNKRTNAFPYIFFEYGDCIFVLAFAVWLSVNYKSGIKTHSIFKFIHEFWVCVIFTNIALKVVWTQLIEFTSIFCTHLSEWITKLHSHVGYDFVQKAPEILKSKTSGHVVLTAIALLMFFFVLQTVNLICYNESLFMKANCLEKAEKIKRKVPKQNKVQSASISDFDDLDESMMKYVEPINGPILSEL